MSNHIVLDDDGAKPIRVLVDKPNELLEIGDNVYTKDEALKLRDFITQNFG
jgi:hypothetical protein